MFWDHLGKCSSHGYKSRYRLGGGDQQLDE